MFIQVTEVDHDNNNERVVDININKIISISDGYIKVDKYDPTLNGLFVKESKHELEKLVENYCGVYKAE